MCYQSCDNGYKEGASEKGNWGERGIVGHFTFVLIE